MLAADINAADIRAQSIKEGMATLKHDGMLKVRDEITTMAEVVQAALGPGQQLTFSQAPLSDT